MMNSRFSENQMIMYISYDVNYMLYDKVFLIGDINDWEFP